MLKTQATATLIGVIKMLTESMAAVIRHALLIIIISTFRVERTSAESPKDLQQGRHLAVCKEDALGGLRCWARGEPKSILMRKYPPRNVALMETSTEIG